MSTQQQSSHTVLVVDDVPENIDRLCEMLQPLYTVKVAGSGEKAIQIVFSDAPPDLILLDVMMPGMDGHTVCERIKASPDRCDIPVLFVTALDEVDDEKIGLELGAADYIAKPISPSIVLPRVKTHLALYEKRRSLDAQLAEREHRLNELARLNSDLIEFNRKFDTAQAHLSEAEKMASIGQLAAGVAHEINNPIAYIQSNFSAVGHYFDQVFALVNAYERRAKNFPAGMQMEMARLREKLEYDHIVSDIPSLIRESKEGMNKVTKIVRDLADLSGTETEAWEKVDLTARINNALDLVRGKMHDKIRIVCDFSDLPPVECMPCQLNQVFLNILVNAAYAIIDYGQITIRTSFTDGIVCIGISDTGHGIAPEHIPRIFDAFFTTRPTGQGTGLGLSHSYSIVRKHHGRIDVESKVGEGTTFIISIPVRRPTSTIQTPNSA